MDLSTTMLSVPRPSKHYVHFVVSMFKREQIPVTIMAGHPDTSFIEQYIGDPLVAVVAPSETEYAPIADQPVRARAVWNFGRALGTKIGRNGGKSHRLVMEDDVQLSLGWLPYLDKVRQAVEQLHERYIVSLYVPADDESGQVQFDFPNEARQRGEIIAPYPIDKFYGTQALFMPDIVRAELEEWIKGAVEKNDPDPYDWLTRRFVAGTNCPFYCSIPVLAQHIGFETTGLAGKAHKAKWFEADVRQL